MAATMSLDTQNSPSKNGDNIDVENRLKERAEKNRQRALLLRKSKVVTHPYANRYIYLCIHILKTCLIYSNC